MQNAKLAWSEMNIDDRLGPVQYEVTPMVAAAYADATECALSGDLVNGLAHPTLTATDYAKLLRGRYGELGTGLHVAQESTFLRPVPVGAVISTSGQVVDLFERRGRDYWVIEYEATDADGMPYVRHRMTSTTDRPDQKQPSRKPAGAAEAQNEDVPQPRAAETDGAVGSITRAFTLEKQIEFGRQYVFRFTDETYVPERNAHSDPDYARSVGLPDAVGHSNHYYAWFAELALSTYGEDWHTSGWLSGKFLKPVFPGDVVRVIAHFEAEGAGGGDGVIDLSAVTDAGTTIAVARSGMRNER